MFNNKLPNYLSRLQGQSLGITARDRWASDAESALLAMDSMMEMASFFCFPWESVDVTDSGVRDRCWWIASETWIPFRSRRRPDRCCSRCRWCGGLCGEEFSGGVYHAVTWWRELKTWSWMWVFFQRNNFSFLKWIELDRNR